MAPMPPMSMSHFSLQAPISAMRKYPMNTEKLLGTASYRIGLKMKIGWIYAEGLTHFEKDEFDRLLFAGHGFDGKLAVALELSTTPFE